MGWQGRASQIDNDQPDHKWAGRASLITAPKGKPKAPEKNLSLNPLSNLATAAMDAEAQVGRGVSELREGGHKLHGSLNVGMGALGYVGAPWTAANMTAGNLYERAADYISPGQTKFKSEDMQQDLGFVEAGLGFVKGGKAAPVGRFGSVEPSTLPIRQTKTAPTVAPGRSGVGGEVPSRGFEGRATPVQVEASPREPLEKPANTPPREVALRPQPETPTPKSASPAGSLEKYGPLLEAQKAREELQGQGPPVQPGTVRYYHGGDNADRAFGGKRWATTDPVYARDFLSPDKPNKLHYVDVPKEHPVEVNSRMPEGKGHTHALLPEELAKDLKPLKAESRTELKGPEKIAHAYVKAPDGAIFTGITHSEAAMKAEDAGHNIAQLRETDGFVTSHGREVNRKEAKVIADAQKQVKDRSAEHLTGDKLHAEQMMTPEQKAANKNVKGSTLLRPGALDKLRSKEKQAPQTPSERITAALADPANREVNSLGRTSNNVDLVKVRAALSDLSRAEQDAAIRSHHEPGVALYPNDNRPTITPEQRDNAVDIGNESRHFFFTSQAPAKVKLPGKKRVGGAMPGPGEKPWSDMTVHERMDYTAKRDEADFLAVKKDEPNITREEFIERKEAGRTFFKRSFDPASTQEIAPVERTSGAREAQVNTPPRPRPVGAAPTGYPEISTTGKGGAQAILQQRLGIGAREAEKAITALEPYQRELNAAPRSERLKVIDYMENRSHGNTSIDPKYQTAANEMRKVYKDVEYRLGSTSSTEHMGFIEDYFRHQVKDPKKIHTFMSSFKEGSARGATKQRSFPTVSDLLEAGHELVNDNPVEVTMDYAYHMNKFIATNEAFDIAKEQGTIKIMNPSRVPEGWVPIQGRHGGMNSHGQAAYAPAEFAVPWNRFVSRGFTGLGGDIIQGARVITNVITAIKLFSGYHLATMTASSFSSDLSRAFDNIGYGRPVAAARTFGSALTVLQPMLRQLKTGLRGQRAYAGKKAETRFGYTPRGASPEEHKVIDYLAQANFRPSKIDKSISVTQTGNLYTAWKRGALSHQVRSQMSDVAAARGVMKAAPIARGVWSLFGRSIDTAMAPLFEKFIPALKMGAAMESLRDFLIASPNASFEEIMTEARAVQRNMDDRFGEMNHDNLFWNQKLKEGLQGSMLSYSWNVGIARAIGGGGKDIVAALGSKATAGKFGSAGWTRRASYALAFPIGAAYLSAVYQALKTGQAPRGPQDLLAGRTGGVNPATKYRKESDERVAIPGHMKDIFELRDIITGDKTVWDVASNKLNTVLVLAGDLTTGQNWRKHPIADPEASTQSKIGQYLTFALGEEKPIFLQQLEARKEGTGISLFETVLGVHPAPDFLQDPSGHGDMMRAKAARDYVKTLNDYKNEAERRGNHDKAAVFKQEIHRRQQQLKRAQP